MKNTTIKGLNVTMVNPSTQQAQHMLNAYERTTRGDSIYTAYGKPSSKKVHAFFEIKKEMDDVGGYRMRITGAGSDIFSCAYTLPVEDKKYLIYHTPSNRFAVLMDE